MSCTKESPKIVEEPSGNILFFDDFEKGDLSQTENNISYGSSTYSSVSNEVKKDGEYSLRFYYKGGPSGEDAFSEQRISYSNTGELWIKYELYIPVNYTHRKENSASNNKFLAVYKNDYRYPGFHVNWSLSPNNTGGSNLTLHRYRNGTEQSTISPSGELGTDFITKNDQGKWIHIMARIKAPSSEKATDGVMQLWKNDVLVCDETALNMYGGINENFMNEMYLMGWSNSGYLEDTVFYIDNLSLNYSAF
ncbi:polysaccharide lyase-like protein [Tenacibaculum gallaicum]|uniref:Polysaccharide lyase-like protein n=1 Tax=Tenacibaculum gallaicum TaxID=561505 RepID=A0A3E0ICA2_9FLAO|nr:heparin lyase I family protein [Tenacibaculum gallaicum]REH56370.1 polysaccharide lyase-like protein [Tenacibaculum gallaicum]